VGLIGLGMSGQRSVLGMELCDWLVSMYQSVVMSLELYDWSIGLG
jgi:hypothetical protein